jgi:hypothetical protein
LEHAWTGEIVCHYPLLAEVWEQIGGETSEVSITGKNYRFRLEREKPTDGWEIERIAMEPATAVRDSWAFPKHLYPYEEDEPIGYAIFNSLGVGLFTEGSRPNLPYIFQSNHLKILKIETITNGEKKQTLLEFEYSYDDFSEIAKRFSDYDYMNHPLWKPYYMKGEVVLETDYYLISSGKFHTRWRAAEKRIETECEFDTTTYRVPLPVHYTQKTQFSDSETRNSLNLELLLDFDLRETNPKDTKRFTLSAFGLPEPDFGQRRMSLSRIVMMALGGIMVFYALWKMWFERKENKKP